MAASEKAPSISAVLVAAGSGLRFAENKNGGAPKLKQFLSLQGRPIYLWSLSQLYQHNQIKDIVVTVPKDKVAEVNEEISGYFRDGKKHIHVIAGGITRQESVWLALNQLKSIPQQPEYVLIHDAARPFLTAKMIDDTTAGVLYSGACTTGIPISDTVKKIDADDVIVETINRDSLQAVQTPQAARFDWLYLAHSQAQEEGIETTDDAAILEAAGRKITVIPGSVYNIKLTKAEDLLLCEALANLLFKQSL